MLVTRLLLVTISLFLLHAVQGDILRLIRRVDSNWYEGRVQPANGRTIGQRGLFPVNYVQTLVEPQSAPTTPVSSLAPSPVPEGTSNVPLLCVGVFKENYNTRLP